MNEPRPRILSAAELARVQRAIAEHAPNFKSCPLCGQDKWGIVATAHNIALAQRTSGSLMLTGGLFVPLLPVICQVCGNTVFFSMYQLGIQDMFGFGAPGTLTSDEQTGQLDAMKRRLTEVRARPPR